MVITDKYVLFWKDKLSNFNHSPYTAHDGIKFLTSEQEFMYRKAKFFEDDKTALRILKADTPREAKNLGRQVKNYNDESWSLVRESIMYQACLNKFSANPQIILDPRFKNLEFVEANPYDSIWAIGLSPEDPKARDKANWKGQNLLGKVLERVRKTLLMNNVKI